MTSQVETTYNTALQAAAQFGDSVVVFDSLGASASLTLTVIPAAEMAQQGADMQTIVATLEHLRAVRQHLFTLKSLKYLRNRGLISGFQATLGKLLGVNPVMTFKDGAVATVAQSRGYKRALDEIIQKTKAFQQANPGSRIIFGYAPDSDEYLKYMREALVTAGVKDYGSHPLGATVVANTGPGAIAVVVEPA